MVSVLPKKSMNGLIKIRPTVIKIKPAPPPKKNAVETYPDALSIFL